jgi:hypothetical protein
MADLSPDNIERSVTRTFPTVEAMRGNKSSRWD